MIRLAVFVTGQDVVARLLSHEYGVLEHIIVNNAMFYLYLKTAATVATGQDDIERSKLWTATNS
jgi:hypothetical protein